MSSDSDSSKGNELAEHLTAPLKMSGTAAPTFYDTLPFVQPFQMGVNAGEHQHQQWYDSYASVPSTSNQTVDTVTSPGYDYSQYDVALADQWQDWQAIFTPPSVTSETDLTAAVPMAGGKVPTKRRMRSPASGDSESEDGHGRGTRLPGACKHCRRLKMKCDFSLGATTCKRCQQAGHTCIVEERKKTRTVNKREYLFDQLREKDEIIERLLKHIFTKSQLDGIPPSVVL